MIATILKAATGRRLVLALLLLAGAGFLAFALGPYSVLQGVSGSRPLPEESSTAAPAVRAYFDTIGEPGRRLYAQFQRWDFLNPVLVAVAGSLLLGWLLKRAQMQDRLWRFAILLPLAAALADALENVLLLAAIRAYPQPAPGQEVLAGLTQLKFASLMVAAPFAAGLAIVAVARRRAGHARPLGSRE